MDIDNLNLRIFLQMLAEFGDIHIHRARIEVVVVNPDGLQCEITLKNLVGMSTKKSKKLILLSSQLGLLITMVSNCFCVSKVNLPMWYMVDSLVFLPRTRRRIASTRNTSSSIEKGLVI